MADRAGGLLAKTGSLNGNQPSSSLGHHCLTWLSCDNHHFEMRTGWHVGTCTQTETLYNFEISAFPGTCGRLCLNPVYRPDHNDPLTAQGDLVITGSLSHRAVSVVQVTPVCYHKGMKTKRERMISRDVYLYRRKT
ncbi:hypothetical protein J6590_059439 [Homalodisca vitripennis]|nr:hypothetical protein J6590_059439 [Homalodisca vitripennis]